MATKKRIKRKTSAAAAGAPKRVTKTAYVLGQPRDMTANDVVKKAKADGITLTPKHVYVIRSSAKLKKKTSRAARGAAKRSLETKANGIAAPSEQGSVRSSDEATFRKIVARIGVTRAQGLMAEVERRIAGL